MSVPVAVAPTGMRGDESPGPFEGQSIDSARRILATRLRDAGSDSAELDARMLLGAALGLDLTGLVRDGARMLSGPDDRLLQSFMRRRMSGEPVARITGTKEFWGLPLALSRDTLVPRPDTETVVETALDLIRAQERERDALRIIDIGTGSGAILLALLSELSGATGVGTDISEGALRTARSNAAALGLDGRAVFVNCSFTESIGGSWDLIVSNPPYIRSGEIPELASEVRDHDPLRALDGGPDGLDAYRLIGPQAARLLVSGGLIVVEAGIDQAKDIGDILVSSGLTICGSPVRDLAGIPRAVAARKPPR